MGNRFFLSDLHLGHQNTWEKFKNADGTPLRPFTSTEEMDETIIENWNKTVKPHDTVYVLGDVVINRKFLEKCKRLNGKRKLIFGNHDIFKLQDYLDAGFYAVHAYRVFVDDFVCSHIPLHPDCISTRYVCNVHGHLHGNRVMWEKNGNREIDPRYFNVSVEQVNYTPISYDDLKIAIKKQMEDADYEPPKGTFEKGPN